MKGVSVYTVSGFPVAVPLLLIVPPSRHWPVVDEDMLHIRSLCSIDYVTIQMKIVCTYCSFA